ncbi:MAG: hypothetical protein FWG63_04565 [Defluviitaleaceae bacterium]|nr:hypothetical protein [Defluviitaleaceae bacterium]
MKISTKNHKKSAKFAPLFAATAKKRLTTLKQYILQNTENTENPTNTIFISICNTKHRARVFKATEATIADAFDLATKKVIAFIQKNNYNAMWLKVDIVDFSQTVLTTDLVSKTVKLKYSNFFRMGISLDSDFKIAFLESELNANRLIKYYSERDIADKNVDYNANLLNLDNINLYLQNMQDKSAISELPSEIIFFTTQGVFCDENNAVWDLHNSGMSTGRRKIAKIANLIDNIHISECVISASKYLYNMLLPSGQFEYGFWQDFNRTINGYNILRHASSLWSLINLYRMTADSTFIDGINNAMAFLENEIEYQNESTAFLVEKTANEIKLGGNAVAIIAMTEYMEVFGSLKYNRLVEHLANGILYLQNVDTGGFVHVLNFPDFVLKEQYRTIYYDGEATFALTRAYTYTGKKEFLAAATSAVEYLINNNYTKYRDHWVAYSLHEITKYLPIPRYFEFALKNVADNMQRIYNQTTSYHTYLELLTITWQTYQRILENEISTEYITNFDVKNFAQTIYKRAIYMLNSYFFPEIAMYMKSPQKALNSFFVRHDRFRVRIDDIQHFIGGYYYLLKNWDNIAEYLTEDFMIGVTNDVL